MSKGIIITNIDFNNYNYEKLNLNILNRLIIGINKINII